MGARRQSEIAVSIPFDDIDKIEIYQNVVNKKTRKRLPLSTIMSKTGADYAINGTLYDMRNGKPVCPLKYKGEVFFRDRYLYRGYAWDNFKPKSFHLDLVPTTKWSNYIACSNILRNNNALSNPIYNVAQGGKRGRTAIGTKYVNGKYRLCLYASKDGSTAKKTPEQLATLLQSYGWQDAVMLDCGRSSQGYFRKEKRQVYSSRRVAHVILIYLKKGKK